MNNDVFALDDNNNPAIRTISVQGVAESNSPSVFTTDENGNAAVRVVGNGGGSSDQHNLGWYTDLEALQTAHPTGVDGDFAILGSTDTVWVWDSGTSAWKDTDTKGQVTSVNNRTGAVTVSEVPDQTGYSGRVLGTDGFVAGWVEPEIVQRNVMPQADSSNVNKIYEFVGTTDANYTNGYFYKNIQTSSYDSTVTFQPATLSSSTIACSGSDFAAFVSEWGTGDITTITNGTLTYDQSGGLLVFVGKDAEDTTVCTFQMYTEDYQDAGFTITGTLQDGDVFAFTTTITESFSYAWTRVDVQPTPSELPNQSGNSGKFLTTDGTNPSWATVGGLPSQTGNSGKFLTTDGTDASWATISALQNTATGTGCLTINGTASTSYQTINIGDSSSVSGQLATVVGCGGANAAQGSVAMGHWAKAGGNCSVGLGTSTNASGNFGIALGYYAYASGNYSIQLNASGSVKQNSDANTFKVANSNGNFEIMSADGTIPAARHASLPAADGTYVLKLVIADGTPTLSWVAE